MDRFIYIIKARQEAGIDILLKEEVAEHFALIDEELVWHGGMNLLGKEDIWDNLMRIKSGRDWIYESAASTEYKINIKYPPYLLFPSPLW